MPRPVTCCESPSGTVISAWRSPKAAPDSAATPTPVHRSAPLKTLSQPIIAPKVMMPSMPKLSTPDRSQSSAPSVPKMSGVAMRSTEAQTPLEPRISISSIGAPAR